MPSRNTLTSDAIFGLVKERFAERIAEEQVEVPEPHLVLVADGVEKTGGPFFELMKFLKDDERLHLDYLSCVSAIDYPDRQVIEEPRPKKPSIAGASEKPRSDDFTERPYPPAEKRS